MTLHHHPDYPSTGYYVLKLHRDTDLMGTTFRGRVEHVITGEHADFGSADALIALLRMHARGGALAERDAATAAPMAAAAS